ncbi:MAG: response regulator transcription factor [Candidatus Methylopumilus sp.]|nr:response regulator transcription factor [Candidatus Methylopumilus sp.]
MSTNTPIRVMLVDDHAVVRAGVRRLLEQDERFSVVAEAETGERAYQIFGEHLPDISVLDLSMPGIGGMETIKRIVARYPTAKILVLSMHENAAFASQALKAGAKGYLAKSGLAEELSNAIQWVMTGQTYLGTEISHKIALQMHESHGDPMQVLSAREFEIFRMLVDGVELSIIASTLNISLKTVANYQTGIKQKLGVSSPVEMVRMAIRCGLIEN